MNRFSILFAGIFATFAAAWLGFVAIPYFQIGHLKPVLNEDTNTSFPPVPPGLASEGHRVYAQSGCVYCHTQQVRGASQGADLERGWGTRRTVARDYIYEKPAFLGTMRTGPDLANIGARQRGDAGARWHHLHLYNPSATSPGSIMPSFRYLYTVQKIEGHGSPDALQFDAAHAPKIPDDYEIVPTSDAKALVAYLLYLDHSYALPEAPKE